MGSAMTDNRPPTPVVALVGAALLVVGLLLAQSAIGFLFSILRLVLILVAFAAIGAVGLYLWRRGESVGPAD